MKVVQQVALTSVGLRLAPPIACVEVVPRLPTRLYDRDGALIAFVLGIALER